MGQCSLSGELSRGMEYETFETRIYLLNWKEPWASEYGFAFEGFAVVAHEVV